MQAARVAVIVDQVAQIGYPHHFCDLFDHSKHRQFKGHFFDRLLTFESGSHQEMQGHLLCPHCRLLLSQLGAHPLQASFNFGARAVLSCLGPVLGQYSPIWPETSYYCPLMLKINTINGGHPFQLPQILLRVGLLELLAEHQLPGCVV